MIEDTRRLSRQKAAGLNIIAKQDAVKIIERHSHQRNGVWLAGMSAMLLLALIPYSSYVVAVPLIQAEWQLSHAQSGLVFSSYLVGLAVSALLFVPLTDRLSTRKLMTAGVLTLITAHLLFPLLARDLWSGCLLRLTAGAGHALTYVPGIQLASRRFAGEKRGTAVGVFVSAGYAGTTLSYSFMGQLLEATGSWRTAYLWTALFGLPAILLALLLPQAAADQAGKTERGRLRLAVLQDRRLAVVILAYALHSAELFLSRLWFPLLLGVALAAGGRAPLEATAMAGTLSGFMFMTGIAGVLLGGWLSDHLGRYRGAALIFAGSGLCSFIAGWLLAFSPIWLIGLGFVYGFLTAADSAIYATAVTELAPADSIGSAQAIQSFLGFMLGAIVPALAGSILDASQSDSAWGWAFSFNGALAVMGVTGLVWLRRATANGLQLDGRGSGSPASTENNG